MHDQIALGALPYLVVDTHWAHAGNAVQRLADDGLGNLFGPPHVRIRVRGKHLLGGLLQALSVLGSELSMGRTAVIIIVVVIIIIVVITVVSCSVWICAYSVAGLCVFERFSGFRIEK